MAKRVHVAGIFVSCMSSVPRAFVRMPNSRAALTIHAKLFTFTRVKRVHARVHTHACVKFKVSGTVSTHSEVNVMQRSRNQLTSIATPLIYIVETADASTSLNSAHAAFGQKCMFCHKFNHFSRVCHSRQRKEQFNS